MGPAALGIIDTFNHSSGPKHVTVITHDDTGGDEGALHPEDPDVTEVHTTDGKLGSEGQKTTNAAETPQEATVEPADQIVAAGQPIAVGVDARALADSSDLRVIIVPKDTPDSVADPKTFFVDAKAVAAAQMQVELIARTPGPSELRLYSIPHGGSDYVVSARMPMMVTPPASDAPTTPAPATK
jgi:hypothetical protein